MNPLLLQVLNLAVGEVITILIRRTDISDEDRARLLAVQERLSTLKDKEQRIADGN